MPPITQIPPAPQRNSPASFVTRADAFFGAFPNMVTEFNALPTPFINGGTNLAGQSIVDHTGWPVQIRRVTAVMDQVLMSGTERFLLQIIGAGNVVLATGYQVGCRLITATTMSNPTVNTTGVAMPGVSAYSVSGTVTFLYDWIGDVWNISGRLVLLGAGTDYIALIEGRVDDGGNGFRGIRYTRVGASNITSGYCSFEYEQMP